MSLKGDKAKPDWRNLYFKQNVQEHLHKPLFHIKNYLILGRYIGDISLSYFTLLFRDVLAILTSNSWSANSTGIAIDVSTCIIRCPLESKSQGISPPLDHHYKRNCVGECWCDAVCSITWCQCIIPSIQVYKGTYHLSRLTVPRFWLTQICVNSKYGNKSTCFQALQILLRGAVTESH